MGNIIFICLNFHPNRRVLNRIAATIFKVAESLIVVIRQRLSDLNKNKLKRNHYENGNIQNVGIAAALLMSISVMAYTPTPTPTPPPSGGGGGDFPSVSDFSRSGPFATTGGNEGPSCTVYRPRTLGAEGRRHPIIIWGNGTGASPGTYGSLLNHWASHGFVVAAARTSNAGSGDQMIDCLDYLVQQNGRSSGTYAGKLNLNKVGSTGHSQGGGGSIMAGRDGRVTVTAPFDLTPLVWATAPAPASAKRTHVPDDRRS
ncbi:hypothetical protein L3081_25655 [Colwellia sp. MSW7]|uniref:PET hydrolase/cutinase-like domain-containing protein n=1 Tax=Colwellia maritima TaxID=2912588 RepID=A0ABS9X9S3_9GAMM|nr:hypothetical protein [Colwellia maritima]MCI2286196.1 hypothetical protein [Colwellia maritima]